MKVKDIQLYNFAKYEQVSVSFDDNVTYLVGKNGSGKSTLGITAIWFMFQGIAEKASGGNNPLIGERFRFIGNKAATAKGEMTLYDEAKGIEIKVLRKLTKTGSDLSFVGPDGMVLDQKWLTDLFNIFLIAPKKFQELSPKEQAKAIGIDTSSFDAELAELKKKFTEINAVYRTYGNIDPVAEVARVDIAELQNRKTSTLADYQTKRKAISDDLARQYQDNKAKNTASRNEWEQVKKNIDTEIRQFNDQQAAKTLKYNACYDAHSILASNGYIGSEVGEWLFTLKAELQPQKTGDSCYPAEPEYITEMPDSSALEALDKEILEFTTSIDSQIQLANNANTAALLYEQYLEKVAAKKIKEQELSDNKKAQEQKESARIAYIKAFNFPFSNLSVGDDGELLLSGKPIKEPYFSTGELLKIIPILISTGNPEFKYVFLQDFNLLDEDKQAEVTDHLIEKGFQLVVEYVSKEPVVGKNCILLKDNVIVDSYEEEKQPELHI